MSQRKVLSALLAGLLITLELGCTMNRDAAKQSYLENGNRLSKAGNWEEASINYRKAIQRDNRFAEAHYQLGLSESHRGNLEDSVAALSRAMELAPQRDDVKIAVADNSLALFLRERSWPAHEEAVRVISQLQQQESFDALRLKGILALVDGKADAARDDFQRANALVPMRPDLVHAYAQALLQGNTAQADQGEKLALDLVKVHPDFLPIYDVLYERFLATNRSADAEHILLEKVKNNPADSGSVAQLAAYYASVHNQVAMQATLDRMLANTSFADRFLRGGDFYRRINQPDRALATYEEGLKAQPGEALSYHRRIVAVLQGQGKRQEALQRLDVALATHPDDADLTFLKAQLLLQAGGTDDLQRSSQLMTDLLKRDGNQAQVHNLLGQIYLAQGNADAAEKQFVLATNQPGYLEPLRALARLRLQHKDYRKAVQYCDSILSTIPSDPDARLIRAMALRGEGSFTQADTELTSLAKQFPQALEPKLELAKLRMAQGQFKDAETLFEGTKPVADDDLRSLQGLAQTYFDERQPEKAVRLLKDRAVSPSATPGVHLLLADAAFAAHQFPLAVQEFAQVATAEPQSGYVQLRWGDALLQEGQLNDSIAHLQAAYNDSQYHAPAAAMLALAYERAGRKAEAIAMYREVLKSEPSNTAVLNNLAFALCETNGDLNEALSLAEKAQRQAPNDPRISDTVGWIYLKERKLDAAVQIFTSDVHLAPHEPVYRYHLALALEQKGDRAAAKENLILALNEKPNGPEAKDIRDVLARLQAQ